MPDFSKQTKHLTTALFALMLSFSASSTFAAENYEEEKEKKPLKIGELAPDFTLKSHAKENIRLNELRGNYILMTFWASWSGASIKLIKQFEQLHQKHSDEGFKFISISIDPEKSATTLDKLQGEHYQLLDYDLRVSKDYVIKVIPSIILLNRDGTVMMSLEGFDPRYHDLVANKVNNLLIEEGN